jgi:hypothetical protein
VGDRSVTGHRRQEPLVKMWEEKEPHYCKSLRSNAELVVRQSPASKDVNTETEEVTVWEAVTRQPVKTRQTEKTK